MTLAAFFLRKNNCKYIKYIIVNTLFEAETAVSAKDWYMFDSVFNKSFLSSKYNVLSNTIYPFSMWDGIKKVA